MSCISARFQYKMNGGGVISRGIQFEGHVWGPIEMIIILGICLSRKAIVIVPLESVCGGTTAPAVQALQAVELLQWGFRCVSVRTFSSRLSACPPFFHISSFPLMLMYDSGIDSELRSAMIFGCCYKAVPVLRPIFLQQRTGHPVSQKQAGLSALLCLADMIKWV